MGRDACSGNKAGRVYLERNAVVAKLDYLSGTPHQGRSGTNSPGLLRLTQLQHTEILPD